LRVWIMVCWEV